MKSRSGMKKLGETSGRPDFTAPPVVEVACSVQFTELSKFQTPYAGFLWEEFRDEYPDFEEKVPLPHILETFPGPSQPRFQMGFADLPPARRVFFLTKTGNNVIQIQPDRFVHNWRKVLDEDEYPRYDAVKAVFLDQWKRFLSFADAHGLGEVVPDQFELTYVNQIPIGSGWQDLGDVGEILRDVRWESGRRFLPKPETLLWRQTFVMAVGESRLHVLAREGRKTKDGKEILILELTARGFPLHTPGGGEEQMTAWFDLAHAWIVNGFVDLTTGKAQKNLWGRTQ